MAVHVINESRRCLQCKKPLCRLQGCPVQTNVPEMIRLFLDGKINEAGAMLYDNNPMSVFCSWSATMMPSAKGTAFRDGAARPSRSQASSTTSQTLISTSSSSRANPTTDTMSPSSVQALRASS